jgi:hypothetical protein
MGPDAYRAVTEMYLVAGHYEGNATLTTDDGLALSWKVEPEAIDWAHYRANAAPPPVPDAAEVRVADAWNSKGPVYTPRPGEPVPEVAGAKCPEPLPETLPVGTRAKGFDGTEWIAMSDVTWDGATAKRYTGEWRIAGEDEYSLHGIDQDCIDWEHWRVTPPSAPVGRADDEVGFYLRCHEESGHFTPWSKLAPSERLAWQAAFAAGSASSVSRERVKGCAEKLTKAKELSVLIRSFFKGSDFPAYHGSACQLDAALATIESELRRLSDGDASRVGGKETK